MRTEKKKLLVGAAVLVLLGFVLYRSRGALHLGDFSGGSFGPRFEAPIHFTFCWASH